MSGHELLVRALDENWNHETDWVWLLTMVTTAEDRRICYERALAINQISHSARHNHSAPQPTAPAARTTDTWQLITNWSG
ncbi:MAG: hypothetical protein IT324_17875 [Anaerolineae bacterium]|nr:hypothetical protein [Anaerolineae bacterium]